jgi:hypothetical protein
MRWRLPKSGTGRYLVLPLAIWMAAMVAAYLMLLAAEAYSAFDASKILDRVEALRLGSSISDFQRATRPCKIERDAADHVCVLTPVLFRTQYPWVLLWKLPDDWGYWAQRLLDRGGLRYWHIVVSASVHEGRIASIATSAYVVGRYEALGAKWEISDAEPKPWAVTPQTADDRRTMMHWYHITSLPSGEGFWIHATSASTEKELRARRMNRKCLFSFRGCDGLCELMPDALPVLRDRKRSWGGWCGGIPRSWCD